MSQVKGRLVPGAVIAGFLLGVLLVGSAETQVVAEPDIRDVTLKLGGPSCQDHVERVESALLRTRGVAMVDIEKQKGYVVVGYDGSRVSINDLLQAVGKVRGDKWSCSAQPVAN